MSLSAHLLTTGTLVPVPGTRHSYGAMDLEQECVFIAVCLLRTVCMIVLDRHDHALVKYKSFF